MNKPISMIIEEVKINIVNTVNESGLPPFILESILKDIYFETMNLSKQIAERDKAEYEKSLQESPEQST